MSENTPRPAYQLPDTDTLAAAVDEALADHDRAAERLGRLMAVVTARAMRDALTDGDPGAPFDATHAELTETETSALFATGRYWSADGAEHMLEANAVFDMNEWITYLAEASHTVWSYLVTDLPDRDNRPVYRFDLVKAAALPLD
ncbi:hypothetical protein [Streptomyces sp. NPDC046925]|uniref:hypothetical protein n=1 Tax=Streptomyces sp. NPDC046925 TaxID=3155375 RepID=UPI00340E2152